MRISTSRKDLSLQVFFSIVADRNGQNKTRESYHVNWTITHTDGGGGGREEDDTTNHHFLSRYTHKRIPLLP